VTDLLTIHWTEAGEPRGARWQSEGGTPPPKRVVVADDTITADAAYRLACEGTGLLWRGDFQNARQLLQAIARRADRKAAKPAATITDAFNLHRQAQSQRARTLGMVLLPFDAAHLIPLRRAPDVQAACTEAYGPRDEPYVASLRELLGIVGAHEWRRKGVEIPAIGGRIHPHYGVFSPVRGEYVQLVAETPLPSTDLAFDIGTGTGVLAAVLARRGVKRSSPPIRTRVRSPAPARTSRGWASMRRSTSCRPTCSPKAARRWWSAIRRGCRRGPRRRWNTPSTTRTAGCCADSSRGSRRISRRVAKAG
jgi:hypothetical protein